jgi:hypothetical protein
MNPKRHGIETVKRGSELLVRLADVEAQLHARRAS